MSIRYTPPAAATFTPGPGDDYFWKFKNSGLSPNDVELKTSNGATGLDVSNPADTRMKLWLKDYFGFKIGGSILIDGNKQFSNVIAVNGASISANSGVRDFATGEYAFQSITEIFQQNLEITDNVEVYDLQTTKSGKIETVGNLSTGDNVFKQWEATQEKTEVQVAGLPVMVYGANQQRFIITDGVQQRFGIASNGNIQTDQAIAGVRLAPTGELLEIFDMAGASKGFIELVTKV